MKSWKTSVGGLISAVGVWLKSLESPAWAHSIGDLLMAFGVVVIGITARDNNVTSEDVGAK